MAPSEDPAALLFERCFYIGNILQSIILYVAFDSIALLRERRYSSNRFTGIVRTQDNIAGNRVFLIAYVLVMLVCMTFALATNGLAGQRMWIEFRDVEGGPFQQFTDTASNWENVTGTAFDQFGNFLGDLLLRVKWHFVFTGIYLKLYRCYVIWDSNKLVLMFPTILFLGSTAMAIVSCVQSALPGSSFFEGKAVSFAIPWISLTCSLNVLLTILITYRLVHARRYVRLGSSLQASDLVRMYTGPVAIFIESALPFSVLGVIFAILLGKGVAVYAIFSAVWGSYVGIAPLLIIHRMASGKAWTRNTAYQMSTINENLTEEPTVDAGGNLKWTALIRAIMSKPCVHFRIHAA
ncbi:hypothetical protein AAF712_006226 [Marasmius tenuissimus]|uniref:Uncharacterized protein n=1 Tax=Marasmius tenuissimus TaxID=585030 RepID=A0ABR2ZZL2_9AGAR